VSIEPRRLERGGEGPTIVVLLAERARPLLLVNGELILRGPVGDPGRVLFTWDATLEGHPLSRGRYALTLEAEDRLGNVSAPTEVVIVRIVRPRR
jgi:hypothetical protein